MMFGQNVTVAAQDPSYPVYVDSSVIMGMTGGYNHSTNAFDGLEYMACRPENGFFPDLSKAGFFCSASFILSCHTMPLLASPSSGVGEEGVHTL